MLQEFVGSLPPIALRAAQVGDRRTAEVERIAVGRKHHFRRVGVEDVFVRVERFNQRRDFGGRIVETSGNQPQLFFGDERFVALDIDDRVESFAGRSLDAVEGFAAAVGSAAVFGGGHNGLSAESFDGADDPFVVARHVTVGEKGVRFFVDVPDHAREVGQRFAWESGRCVPCRYQCQEFHVFRFFNGRRAADAESFTGLNALQI